ncbi:hypothetical protein DOTSEDRAFT_52166 [Dothistroma septosporum NZE10]|uniref:Spherulin 4-like cell surface protein n=1 Tax=Dothistroma septosporum (strain NZE10 / CBS 128990) TaxID=675120 RepID=N1PV12_DOTSN|nr:hypothetical protein DOTSEDRAFT_52166 [Dothistroma septosporum NZE10]
MELPQRPARQSRSRKCLCIGIPILAVILLLVIIVPAAVILTEKRGSIGLPSTILLPLYLYPTNDAWKPLYKAIEKAPKLNFTVIVNPSNGPGGMTDLMHFKPALQKLAAFRNVQTVGYVTTENGTRSTGEVQQDILKYSTWSNMPLNCTLNGIFFDNTPYVEDEETESYLVTINHWAKTAPGIYQPKMVIHKSTEMSPLALLNGADIMVGEWSYDELRESQASWDMEKDRSHLGFVVNSVPESASMKDLVKDMSRSGEFLFATESSKGDAESFGERWKDFVDAMEKTV